MVSRRLDVARQCARHKGCDCVRCVVLIDTRNMLRNSILCWTAAAAEIQEFTHKVTLTCEDFSCCLAQLILLNAITTNWKRGMEKASLQVNPRWVIFINSQMNLYTRRFRGWTFSWNSSCLTWLSCLLSSVQEAWWRGRRRKDAPLPIMKVHQSECSSQKSSNALVLKDTPHFQLKSYAPAIYVPNRDMQRAVLKETTNMHSQTGGYPSLAHTLRHLSNSNLFHLILIYVYNKYATDHVLRK